MAEEIISKCSNLRITKNENSLVSLEDTLDDDVTKTIDIVMVGKVIAS